MQVEPIMLNLDWDAAADAPMSAPSPAATPLVAAAAAGNTQIARQADEEKKEQPLASLVSTSLNSSSAASAVSLDELYEVRKKPKLKDTRPQLFALAPAAAPKVFHLFPCDRQELNLEPAKLDVEYLTISINVWLHMLTQLVNSVWSKPLHRPSPPVPCSRSSRRGCPDLLPWC